MVYKKYIYTYTGLIAIPGPVASEANVSKEIFQTDGMLILKQINLLT